MLRFLKTRTYATEASSALKVSFALPHQTIINNKQLTQVNLTTTDGDVANHVPTILQLKPGKITFLSSDKESESWFASGGFALIHPDSTLKINAVEAFSLDDIDFEMVNKMKSSANGLLVSGSDEEKTVARIQLEVLDALSGSKQ